MLTWEDIVKLDDVEKQQQITKYINEHFDKIEKRKITGKAHAYVAYVNQKKIDPNPKFKNIYGLYKNADGKWKSSVKNMVLSD